MNTPYAGAEGMLPQMKGELTRNEKSSHLVNSFPLPSIYKCSSRYETDFTASVVSFISNSLGLMRYIKSIKLELFKDNTSSKTEIKGSS